MASSRFLALTGEQADTHVRKSAGYAGRDNPDTWANFRNSLGWGVRPFIGCMVRMTDKFIRAQNLTRDPANDQVGEDLRDTLMDLGNYALIGVALLDEERLGPESPVWPDLRWPMFTMEQADALVALDRLRSDASGASLQDRAPQLAAGVDRVLEVFGAIGSGNA